MKKFILLKCKNFLKEGIRIIEMKILIGGLYYFFLVLEAVYNYKDNIYKK